MDATKYYKQKEDEQTVAGVPTPQTGAHKPRDLSKIYNNKWLFLLTVIVIFAIAIYVRGGLLHDQGLFEPDGFFYYSWAKAVVNNGLHEPAHIITGTPVGDKGLGEAQGLVFIPAILYTLLSWTKVTLLQVMRWTPVIAALIEMVLAYLIVTRLSRSKLLGLLTMFFIAVSSGNVARTAALVFRGDSFISIPLLASIYLLILGLEKDKTNQIILHAIAMGVVASTTIIIWTGGNIVAATLALILGLLLAYSFIKGDKKLSKKTLIFILYLCLIGILQQLYISLNMARAYSELVGKSFLLFYLPLLLFSLLSYIILCYKDRSILKIFNTKASRTALVVITLLIGMGAILLLLPGPISNLTLGLAITAPPTNATTTNGPLAWNSTSVSYAISSTTQELQKPSYSFLFASFNVQLFLAPIGVLLFLLLSESINNEDGIRINRTMADSNLPAFITLAGYFISMAYLQYNAIRYNAMISIPIAIFSAYCVYSLIKLGSKIKANSKIKTYGLFILIVVISASALWWAYSQALIGLNSGQRLLLISGIGSILTIFILLIDTVISTRKNQLNLKNLIIALFFIAALITFTYAVLESYSSSPADGINPAFLSAMTWMKNNTPTNSVVLALWPDGSVVEGWGNRTSIMDSVGGENAKEIYPFAQYLINTTPDTSYLYSTGKPDYLVARNYWMVELSGLVTEAVPPNPGIYSYVTLSPVNIVHNATTGFYIFSNGVYNVTVVATQTNTTPSFTAYLNQVGNLGTTSPLSKLVFYNESTSNYTTMTYQGRGLNYTFVLLYSGSRILGGLLVTNQLYETNLFKFIFLCNAAGCPYNTTSDNATLHLVHQNNDTKIYKINYTR